jgi:hypothetical protein
VLTGYAEVAAALADPRFSQVRGPQEGDLLKRFAVANDVHRSACAYAVASAYKIEHSRGGGIEALRARIAAIVDKLLARPVGSLFDDVAGRASSCRPSYGGDSS